MRTECAGCGHAGLRVFADLGETPLADVFESDARSAVELPRYPLRAATCEACGLAQLLDVVDDKLLYGSDYGFRTGGSPSSLAYMAELADFADWQAPDGLTVEIGCNDGTLLWELRHRCNRPVVGIEPSGAALSAAARLDDVKIMQEPFTTRLVHDWGGDSKAALIVAANVAAHVADPHDFLEGIRLLLAPDGVAVVEFQYLPDLLAGCMFDLIYHEHRFFYSLSSFRELAARHGLFVRLAVRTEAQGGSMRVALTRDQHVRGRGVEEHEEKVLPGLLAGFQQRAEYARQRIIETVGEYPGAMCGYAASAKSCTLLNWCGVGPDDLAYIADATRSKWGRFTPGTGIEIGATVAGADAPDAYLLLASNYLSGVLRREHEAGFRGEFIVPLPLPVIV